MIVDEIVLWLGLRAVAIWVGISGDEVFYLLMEAVTLALPAWLIHAVALPIAFGARLSSVAVALTFCYVALIAIFYPLIGGLSFMAVFGLASAISSFFGVFERPGYLFLFLSAAPVGAAIGLIIAGFRKVVPTTTPTVGLGADVIGGAVGAVPTAAMVYFFWLNATGAEFGDWQLHPILPPAGSIALVAVVSYVPPLIRTGCAFLNPPPTTSASDAARTAPSR